MFSRISCPSCQYKFTIPEGDMGKRHVCPNCQSPFFAGKSVADGSAVPMKREASADAGFNKTMLGDAAVAAPPIKYNCPRCKTPLESPAAEGGTKKPCPSCGQRLQVPNAPPPPAAAAPNLNKTMLAGDESAAPPIKYNCPACKKPLEASASEALTKKPCSACGQRHQVPAAGPARNPNKTMLVTDDAYSATPQSGGGYGGSSTAPSSAHPPANPAKMYALIGFGAVVLLMLGWIGVAVSRGGKVEDPVAAAQIAELKKQLDQMISDKTRDMELQKQREETLKRQREEDERRYQQREQELEQKRRLALENETFNRDLKAKQEMEAKLADERRRLEDERREAELRRQREQEETKLSLEKLRNELKEANSKQQTVIQQAPPVMVYPPYHPRYYWWW
jgi:Zn finger protein HypA/HybF involved in hydrogenase expression